MSNSRNKAVVLVSGGMDSAVTLAMARELGFACHALSVAYGQRHGSELTAAAVMARCLGAMSHKTVQVDLRSLGGSALTDDIEVPEHGGTGNSRYLCAGPQHHHALDSTGLGRGARFQ